mmetsp:Transcript_37875/g.75487  ORF Transcript_37875/g.75487 Transcript_37875/m.75487 type:complete len:276 (-) Transcript_37875:14-841(-)
MPGVLPPRAEALLEDEPEADLLLQPVQLGGLVHGVVGDSGLVGVDYQHHRHRPALRLLLGRRCRRPRGPQPRRRRDHGVHLGAHGLVRRGEEAGLLLLLHRLHEPGPDLVAHLRHLAHLVGRAHHLERPRVVGPLRRGLPVRDLLRQLRHPLALHGHRDAQDLEQQEERAPVGRHERHCHRQAELTPRPPVGASRGIRQMCRARDRARAKDLARPRGRRRRRRAPRAKPHARDLDPRRDRAEGFIGAGPPRAVCHSHVWTFASARGRACLQAKRQ